jgi:hypothetical protein
MLRLQGATSLVRSLASTHLDKFLQSVRILCESQIDNNPLEIIVAHVSTNRQALAEKFFPSWPCMSPECAAGEFEACCHVPRTSSNGIEVEPSMPWTSRRDDLCPPAGKFVGTWEYPSGNAEEHRRGLHQRIGYPPCISEFKEGMLLKLSINDTFCRIRHWTGNTREPRHICQQISSPHLPTHTAEGGLWRADCGSRLSADRKP